MKRRECDFEEMIELFVLFGITGLITLELIREIQEYLAPPMR